MIRNDRDGIVINMYFGTPGADADRDVERKPRIEGLEDILTDAHDGAKQALDDLLGSGSDALYPVALVLKSPTHGYVVAPRIKNDTMFDVLVEEAKRRLTNSDVGDSRAPAYHFTSSTLLGSICCIVGDGGQPGTSYPVRNGEFYNNYTVGAASLAIFDSENSPTANARSVDNKRKRLWKGGPKCTPKVPRKK